jgi:hypothetical protein
VKVLYKELKKWNLGIMLLRVLVLLQ